MPPAATTSQQALGNLQTYQSGLKAPGDVLSSNQNALGVPGAQQQVSGLRQAITNTQNLLNNVAPGVMGRTGNSLVTAAQSNRIIQNESAPIASTLKQQGQQLNLSDADLKDLMSKAESQTSATLTDQQQKMQYLQNIFSDLSSREQAQAAADESKRQFDAQQALEEEKLAAAKAAGNGGIDLSSLLRGVTGGASSAPASRAPVDVTAGRVAPSSQLLPAFAQGVQDFAHSSYSNPVSAVKSLLKKIF